MSAKIILSDCNIEKEKQKYLHSLEMLKKKGFILDWSLLPNQFTGEYGTDENRNDTEYSWKILMARCRFYPKKVISCLSESFQPKIAECKKLIHCYALFKKIIESHLFQNENFELNEKYKALADEIWRKARHLSKNLIVSMPNYHHIYNRLQRISCFPFRNLFSMQKEMKERGLDPATVIADLDENIGFLQELLSSLELSPKQKKINIGKIQKTIEKMDGTEKPKSSVIPNYKINPNRNYPLFAGKLKVELACENLRAYNDGTIKYGREPVVMRGQIKELCRLFMETPQRLLTAEDIKERIISADKRGDTPRATISKYVSELHDSLKIHFKKNVIFNQPDEGWLFKP